MSESFKVGEIAILVGSKNWPEYNGQEVEILELCGLGYVWADRAHTHSKFFNGYRVKAADGMFFRAPPERLRKKRLPPKREDVGEWDLCPWKPALVRQGDQREADAVKKLRVTVSESAP